ncbi:hypothetical protein KPL71_017134 [Citrus sinensis]|uniref:Uncharacterized protein n=1 Tax=Citrus sinensis TaxID=2711 RepID=A0ACB8JMJ7_CITSI|nr:hypothetical protein KPL71_017134 [Citrus sinensis]
MISAFSTQHKFQSKREETLLLQTDLSKANTVIPKPIQWKDINLPDEWILEGATAPVIPKQLEPNTKLQNVTQYSDDSDKKLKEPIFKSFQVSKTSQKLVHESKSDFAKAIREQLDRIEAYSSSSSKVQIAPDSAQSSKIGVLEQDNMSITSSDREAFKEEPVSKANKIHWELALPTVKSPPDLAIDNRPTNAYKTQLGTSDKAIAEILIAGFTGDPSHLRDKNAELLHNLRCRKLSEFQSYKTTFFTRLFLMDDANHITWKEKFLAGLPTLLEENVMNSIKALYDNRIPYDELTYGELVSFVNKEGLKICQDLKLQKRLKWELRKSKQELESSDSESSMTGDSEPLQVNELIDSYTSASSDSDSDTESYLKKINVLTKDQETFLELVKHITDPTLQKEYLDKLLKTLEGISPKQIMPPKQKDKGKGILKDPISQTPSKASQSSLPKEKLLSSSMPIKSWIDMVEEQEAQSKAIASQEQDCGLGLVVGRDANGHRLQRGDKVENIKQKGGFRACTFVFVFSALENMGFIANGISMVLYFKNEMHFDLAGASNTLTNFFGSTFLLCLVGGFISDTFLSRFATCLIFGTLEVLALVMLTIQAYSKNLHPPDCGKSSCLKGAIAAYFYGSLYLYSLGCGGNRGTLPAFGAGQFDENDPKGAKALASYFNFYLLATTVAAVIGVTGIVYVFTEKSWWLGFLVSSVANFIGLIALAAGKRLYRIQQPDESPLVRVAQVLVVAIKNRKLSLPDNPEELYEINEKERASTWERIPHASQFRCLDKAAIMPKDSAVAAPWRVCTVTQVEEVKILTRMMPILASTILMNTCLAQLQTFSITQGAAMDPHLGSIKVPTSSIPVIPLLFMSILLPLYEFFFVPFARKITGHPSGITQLQRVGIGLVLSAVSMTVAGLVEVIRRNAFNQTPPKQISLFWLSFQYCIFGIADMFTFIGLLEFFYKEAPAGMKTLASSFTYLSLSFGYFLSSAFVDIINAVTKRITPSKQGWLHGKDINKNNVNLFYWFLAIVSVLNLVLYLYAAAWYKYKPENCSDIKPKPLMDPSAKEEKIDQDDGKAKQYGAASSDDGIIGKEKEFIHDEVKSQE